MAYITGSLYVDSYVPIGPGEYTFTNAIYEDPDDPTGLASACVVPGFIMWVPAVDVYTQEPIPGVLHQYQITSISSATGLLLSATMLWDEGGTPVDDPQSGSECVIAGETSVFAPTGAPTGVFTGAPTGISGPTGSFTGIGVTGPAGFTGVSSRIINGTLFVDSYVYKSPGEYSFVDALYDNQSDPTGEGSLAIRVGFVVFVPAIDPNTAAPIPGVVQRYRITSIDAPPDGLHLSATIMWDDEGPQTDNPQSGSYAIITAPAPNHFFGLPVDEFVYPMLPGGAYEGSIIKDILHITDKLGFTGVGMTGLQGAQGHTGFQGYTGAQGLTGLVNFLTEETYPTGVVNIPLLLWNLVDEALFAYVTGMDSWVQISSGSLQGATGASGSGGGVTGEQGCTGVGGGVTGIQGSTGPEFIPFGNQIPLGLPIDGGLTGGIFDWDVTSKVTNCLDDLNELILAIAPAPPGSLAGTLVLSGTTKYSAIAPTGLSALWYQDGIVPGSTVSDYIVDSTYSLASASPTTTFKVGSTFGGDEGAVVHVEDGVDGSTRNITSGVGTSGNVEITDIATYNTIWRKGNARINFAQTTEGYKRHALKYTKPSSDQVTSDTKFWYDDVNLTPGVTTPTVAENTLLSSRYLSGVRYYYLTDTFDFSSTITNIANKGIRPTNPVSYSMPGLSSVNVAISGASFAYNQVYGLAPVGVALNASNVYNKNSTLTVIATKPNGLAASSSSASQNRLVNTYSAMYSTNGSIYMFDENYRFPLSTDFSVIPGSITGNWTSSLALTNGNAQLYDSTWYYPSIDFTSGYLPAQGVGTNYSSFSGDQVVAWGQNIGLAHSSMSIVFTGAVYTDISPVGSGNLNVEIRLPATTGWLDAGRDFGDGAGCRLGSSSGSTLNMTFGLFSSSTSGGALFVRVTLRNSSAVKVSRMVVSGL